MVTEATMEKVYTAIRERNERVASILSLKSDSPNAKGSYGIEQVREMLERIRPVWENVNSLQVGERVEIPVETPVGLGVLGFYIAGKPIEGKLVGTCAGLYGGNNPGEHGTRRLSPLYTVSVELTPDEKVSLLVPNIICLKLSHDGPEILFQTLKSVLKKH